MNNTLCSTRFFALAPLAVSVICLASADIQTAHADDLKVSQLEQEVRELQRVVQQQARRIESLENGMRQSRLTNSFIPRSVAPIPATTNSSEIVSWRQRANWDKLRLGMAEADVLRLLGPPTTLRKSKDGETQTLFYAVELEAGGFLSGDVILVAQKVVDIHKPVLK